MGTTIESDWENTRLREELEAARAEIDKWKAKAIDLEMKRDIAVSTFEKVKADRTVAKNALAEQCKHTKTIERQLAAEQAKNMELRDLIAHAQVSSGVCCCGEPMDGHSSPMSCGHSPVDMWDHAVGKLLDAPSDTAMLEAYVTKAGEKMRVNCIAAAGPEDSYQDDWIRAKIDACDAIRALPAVTLEDLK